MVTTSRYDERDEMDGAEQIEVEPPSDPKGRAAMVAELLAEVGQEVGALEGGELPGVASALMSLLFVVGGRIVQGQARTARQAEGDRLLKIAEAAEVLATTDDWLRRHGERLGLAVKISDGQVRYSAAAIQKFIATRRQATHRAA